MSVMELTRPDEALRESSQPNGHRWVIASFENGTRFKYDSRPPEETGLWTWTCSACGYTEQAISQLVPPAGSTVCPGQAPARGRLSDRLRSLIGDRIIPAEKSWRWENLLCWMDRYQREDFPLPPHWITEALEIAAGATVPVEVKPEAPHGPIWPCGCRDTDPKRCGRDVMSPGAGCGCSCHTEARR